MTDTAASTLPPDGRKGRPPKCPYELGDAGHRWWLWAWRTPQSTRWDKGALYTAGRRAQLEDDLSALDDFDPHALDWLFSALELPAEDEVLMAIVSQLGRIIGLLKGLAGGRLAVLKEMREHERALGLNPAAMAALKWAITAEKEASTHDELLARRAARIAARAAAGSTEP